MALKRGMSLEDEVKRRGLGPPGLSPTLNPEQPQQVGAMALPAPTAVPGGKSSGLEQAHQVGAFNPAGMNRKPGVQSMQQRAVAQGNVQGQHHQMQQSHTQHPANQPIQSSLQPQHQPTTQVQNQPQHQLAQPGQLQQPQLVQPAHAQLQHTLSVQAQHQAQASFMQQNPAQGAPSTQQMHQMPRGPAKDKEVRRIDSVPSSGQPIAGTSSGQTQPGLPGQIQNPNQPRPSGTTSGQRMNPPISFSLVPGAQSSQGSSGVSRPQSHPPLPGSPSPIGQAAGPPSTGSVSILSPQQQAFPQAPGTLGMGARPMQTSVQPGKTPSPSQSMQIAMAMQRGGPTNMIMPGNRASVGIPNQVPSLSDKDFSAILLQQTREQMGMTVNGHPMMPAVPSPFGPQAGTQLHKLIEEVDPAFTMDAEAQELLLMIADDFVNKVVNYSVILAKHRKAEALDSSDIHLCLEKQWGLKLPGEILPGKALANHNLPPAAALAQSRGSAGDAMLNKNRKVDGSRDGKKRKSTSFRSSDSGQPPKKK